MDVKNRLREYRRIDMEITTKLEEIKKLEALATKCTQTFSAVPPSGTRDVSRKEDIMLKIVDLEKQVKAAVDELILERKRIEALIDLVDDDVARQILKMRYLSFMRWERIAAELDVKIRWVYRLHAKSINDINKMLN